eukprot:TRINITY_DN3603_c0_g1_i15.p2 TRINITY_DN3603_c0_g1~~TRINITY_DN3603_c0_g1_i15.p2  ORF type:complete len:131 (+),score=45.67 TRINITY_DN3603_c0_g1_i15:800-1192(+)
MREALKKDPENKRNNELLASILAAKKGHKVKAIDPEFKGLKSTPQDKLSPEKSQEEDKCTKETKKFSSSNPEHRPSEDKNRSFDEGEDGEDSYCCQDESAEEPEKFSDEETQEKSIMTKTYNSRACCIII